MGEEWRFCPQCGAVLVEQRVEGRARKVCLPCGVVHYQDPKVVVAAVIREKDRVLLVRRNHEPGLGLWALPGGYLERGEVVEEAVRREVKEETGLDLRSLGLVGVYSRPGDPVLLVAFTAEAEGTPVPASPEVQAVAFFSPDALPPLAFPRDRFIIFRGLMGG